jgi:hypothetical protein
MTSHRPSALLLAAGLTLAGAAACGEDPAPGPPAASASASPGPSTNGIDALPTERALTAARDAYVKASSVRVKGSFVDGGSRITLDLRQSARGATGTITLDGAKIRLLTIGRTAYFTGDRKFWTEAGGAEAYDLFKGKWVKTSLDAADFKEVAFFAERSFIAEQLPVSGVLGDRRENVRGVPAFKFQDSTEVGYWVALSGEPYPLRLGEGDGEAIDFLDYGKPVDLTPPPASKVFEMPE